MPDMLVKLYELPELAPALQGLARQGITIRPARAPEQPTVVAWMNDHFPWWTAEVAVTFSRVPVSCLLAMRERDLLGFACYDAICPNFFGPTAVLESERRNGIGHRLPLPGPRSSGGGGTGAAAMADQSRAPPVREVPTVISHRVIP